MGVFGIGGGMKHWALPSHFKHSYGPNGPLIGDLPVFILLPYENGGFIGKTHRKTIGQNGGLPPGKLTC